MNTMLHQRLLRIIRQRDAKAMLDALGSLSVSDFRTASTLMREGLLGELAEEDFWTFFHTIVPANSRAYLGTFLKASATKYAYRDITLSAEQVARFASWATDTDKRKFAQALLPILRRPDDFSLASLLGAYFDIQNLPGTFSLRVEPFQLSSISDNYDTFRKIIAP